jgi:hypothetical protein
VASAAPDTAERPAPDAASRPSADTRKFRQAVVVIHGMGEQLPLATLHGFIDAALPRGRRTEVFSRPDGMSQSYEGRRYIARRVFTGDGDEATEVRPQTDFYEYHWSHLMTGNELGHLWPTVRRVLFTWPWKVPSGLRLLWVAVWATVVTVAVRAATTGLPFDLPGDLTSGDDLLAQVLEALTGGGLTLLVLTTAVTFVQRWVTTSFVDVARYLDTSPKSYAVRRAIRLGIVELLRNLHDRELYGGHKYQRIIVVAHSLGAYIGYDAIARLWWEITAEHAGATLHEDALAGEVADGLREVERLASELTGDSDDAQVAEFQRAQRTLWCGLRAQGHPWRITDFVTVGTPMYMAHRIAYRTPDRFEERVERLELPTCPPRPDLGGRTGRYLTFAWRRPGMRWSVLHHAAPFAAVRWTNLWYPARLGIFGDWFGGPLRPLFGAGIRDLAITGDRPSRWLPAGSHSLYFRNAKKRDARGTTGALLREALALESTEEIHATLAHPSLRRSLSD